MDTEARVDKLWKIQMIDTYRCWYCGDMDNVVHQMWRCGGQCGSNVEMRHFHTV